MEVVVRHHELPKKRPADICRTISVKVKERKKKLHAKEVPK